MDEILGKLRERLEALDQYDIDWESKKEAGYNISITDDFGEIWFDTVRGLRALLKGLPREACRKELEKEISAYFWLDDVIKYADDTLIYYRSLAALREVDKKSSETACNFLNLAFQNYVMRINKDFLKTFRQFEMKDANEMMEVLRILDRLADFYVSNCYGSNVIKKDFAGESDLSDEACETFTNLVDKNYMEIKLNLIYNRLCALEEKR